MFKRALVYFMAMIGFSHLSYSESRDERDIRIAKESKAKSQYLLQQAINSSDKKQLMVAIDNLRNTIVSDQADDKSTFPELRLRIYADIYDLLKKDPEISNSLKSLLLDVLSEGAVSNGNNINLQERCVQFLYEIVKDSSKYRLSHDYINNIEKAYENKNLSPRRNIVLLIDNSGSTLADKIIKKSACRPLDSKYGIYNSEVWAATLMAGKRHDRKAIKHLIRLCEAAEEGQRFALLFKDISCVRDKMIVEYLSHYLKSDESLFDNSPCMPVEKVAACAAMTLKRMIEGFPQYKDYNDMEAIESCRRWMEENKDYKFKENGQ